MEPQNNKLLGDLYYSSEKPTLARLPIDDIIKTNSAREQTYLKTREDFNSIQDTLRNLPKDLSPDIYNTILTKTNESLKGIDSTNYADKMLDVNQLSHDIVNKYGGKELLEQQALIQSKNKELDDAYTKGDIVDPSFLNYKKELVKKSVQPLKYDENGFVTKPSSPTISYAKYINGEKYIDDMMKGWEKDGYYKQNEDGSVTILKDIPGYFGTVNGTKIDKQELIKAGIQSLNNNKEYQAYLDDYANYKVKDFNVNAETLNTILTPEMKETLLGNKNADAYDIYDAMQNGVINANQIAKDIYKADEIRKQVSPIAEKYGHTKEELKFYTDNILMKSLETQAKINMQRAKKAETPDTAVITVEPFSTQRIINPTDISAIRTNKNKLVEQRKNLQIELNSYQKGLNDKNPNYSQERLELKQKEQNKLDNQISELETQEKGLRKIMFDNGLKAGVNLDKTYERLYTSSKDYVKNSNNIKVLTGVANTKDNTFNVNVTENIKNINGKNYLVLDNGEKLDITTLKSVKKVGDNYIYSPNPLQEQLNDNKTDNHSTIIKGLKSLIFNDDASLSSNVKVLDESIKKDIYKVPNKSEFYQMAIDAYTNKETNGIKIFDVEGAYTDRNNKTMISNKLLDELDTIRKSQGDFNFELSQPLSYLLVTGDTTKSDTKIYQNYEKAAKADFIKTPEQYNVNVSGKLVSLGDYVKEKYGIPDLSWDYINWKGTDLRTLVENDRNHGQLYGATIALTPKGRELVKDKDETLFNNTNNIKIALVNPNKNYNSQIKEQVIKTYPYLLNQNSEHSTNLKKEIGIVYANNSEEGRQIDSLNLYTMPSGTSKTLNVRGTEYQISTTTKDATQSDLMNVDFHLDKSQGNQIYTLATNDKESIWKPLSEVQKSKEWKRVIFDSPTDIKGVIGASLIEEDIKKTSTNSAPIDNPYQQYMNTNYYKKPNQVIQNNYKKVVKDTKKGYNSISPISVINNKGVSVNINSKVPVEDLYDLRSKYKDRISENVSYPYINKSVTSNLDTILSDYGLTITGGYRGDDTHEGLKDSVEDSLHKYGFGIDFRSDKEGLRLLNDIQTDENVAKKYKIVNILRHGENDHIHVELQPNNI